jgi:hypothetical protein
MVRTWSGPWSTSRAAGGLEDLPALLEVRLEPGRETSPPAPPAGSSWPRWSILKSLAQG